MNNVSIVFRDIKNEIIGFGGTSYAACPHDRAADRDARRQSRDRPHAREVHRSGGAGEPRPRHQPRADGRALPRVPRPCRDRASVEHRAVGRGYLLIALRPDRPEPLLLLLHPRPAAARARGHAPLLQLAAIRRAHPLVDDRVHARLRHVPRHAGVLERRVSRPCAGRPRVPPHGRNLRGPVQLAHLQRLLLAPPRIARRAPHRAARERPRRHLPGRLHAAERLEHRRELAGHQR